MKNADKPAHPVPISNQTDDNQIRCEDSNGLTKREYFTAAALQGLLASRSVAVQKTDQLAYEKYAEAAIEIADQVLKQLDEK